MNAIEIEGIKEIETLLQGMTITETDEKKAMKKAIQVIAEEVEKNTPERTGKLKNSIIKSVRKEALATVGVVKLGKFYDMFQEFGTSRQKAHTGFFERSVNRTQNDAIKILSQELIR